MAALTKNEWAEAVVSELEAAGWPCTSTIQDDKVSVQTSVTRGDEVFQHAMIARADDNPIARARSYAGIFSEWAADLPAEGDV